MRRILIIALIAVFASTTLALAAWKIADMVRGEERGSPPEGESLVAGAESGEGGAEAGSAITADGSSEPGAEAAALPSGEDSSYDDPDQRYVTETQRHQNFFRAVGEGRVLRLEVVSADVRPVGDPDTSYIKFVLTTSDGGSATGTMVMKYDAGMWRIAAFSQLTGDLQGGDIEDTLTGGV